MKAIRPLKELPNSCSECELTNKQCGFSDRQILKLNYVETRFSQCPIISLPDKEEVTVSTDMINKSFDKWAERDDYDKQDNLAYFSLLKLQDLIDKIYGGVQNG